MEVETRLPVLRCCDRLTSSHSRQGAGPYAAPNDTGLRLTPSFMLLLLPKSCEERATGQMFCTEIGE
jgi:hypothetical protein